MDNRQVIASSLSDNELAQAFSELVTERWDNWDLAPFMAYLVDSCAPSALPYLAEQFDVEGLQGFAVAVTEQQQRDLIKRSIALHKYIGTPWAIREACRTVGFPVVVLEEGVTETPGGEAKPDDWARFRVLVEAGFDRHITTEEARKLRSFVEYYKNARSHLAELGFYQSIKDRIDKNIAESFDISFLELNPNYVFLNAKGSKVTVSVYSNVEWTAENTEMEWSDGTGNKLYLEYSGISGHSSLVVSSDIYVRPQVAPHSYSTAYSNAYRRPEGDYNRSKIIKIKTANGKILGVFTVVQRAGSNNAYDRAYSNAYNLFNHEPYLEVEPTKLELDVEDRLNVRSNINWDIK